METKRSISCICALLTCDYRGNPFATFQAPAYWQTGQLLYADVIPYNSSARLGPGKPERIGTVAIGRAFHADVCLERVGFY
jgi:hypothetical protein